MTHVGGMSGSHGGAICSILQEQAATRFLSSRSHDGRAYRNGGF